MISRIALVIPANPEEPLRTEVVDIEKVETLHHLVGGYLQLVALQRPPASMYMNEDAKLIGLDYNARATLLLYVHNHRFIGRDQIAGDVFVMGLPDENGYDTDAPAQLVKLLMRTTVYYVQVRVQRVGPWKEPTAAANHSTWEAAYMRALELIQHAHGVVEARVVPVG